MKRERQQLDKKKYESDLTKFRK
jgi:hypothetical protein